MLRQSCTDDTFSDTNCPHLCTNETYETYDMGADLRQCDGSNDNWICGMNVSLCSSYPTFTVDPGYAKDGREINNILLPPGSASTVNLQHSATPEASHTVDASQALTCPATGSGLGVSVGLGVGIPLVVGLIVTVYFLVKARKEVTALKAQPPVQNWGNAGIPGVFQSHDVSRYTPHQPARELSSLGPIYEVEGRTVNPTSQ